MVIWILCGAGIIAGIALVILNGIAIEHHNDANRGRQMRQEPQAPSPQLLYNLEAAGFVMIIAATCGLAVKTIGLFL
jgi:hypothetical protein